MRLEENDDKKSVGEGNRMIGEILLYRVMLHAHHDHNLRTNPNDSRSPIRKGSPCQAVPEGIYGRMSLKLRPQIRIDPDNSSRTHEEKPSLGWDWST